MREDSSSISESKQDHDHKSPMKSPKQKAAYVRFMQRPGPMALGSREAPRGSPTALEGLTFVFTGELNSFTREDASDIVKRHGGRVTTAPSRKTDFVVLGIGAGEKKLEKVCAMGIKTIDEDGLLDLIKSRSETCEKSPITGKKRKTSDLDSIPQSVSDGNNESMISRVKLGTSSPSAFNKQSGYHFFASSNSATGNASPTSSDLGFDTKNLAKLLVPNGKVENQNVSKNMPQGNGRLWTQKYAPENAQQLIGNRGVYDSLVSWLRDWNMNRKKESGSKPIVPKAVLISGPPGIGKTTSAHLACKQVGMDIVELNASDTRSKLALQSRVKEVIGSKSLLHVFQKISDDKNFEKNNGTFGKMNDQVLIMDEVDGMSSGDRGGMMELIQLIKKTRIPIVCICNDRSSPKVRSLSNYCLDLRFRRPDARQVIPRVSQIAQNEGIYLGPNAVEELVHITGGDIRQILTLLWSFKAGHAECKEPLVLDFDTSKHSSKKDVDRGPFEVLPNLLGGAYNSESLGDRVESYFVDSSMVPLMIHENYLKCRPSGARHVPAGIKTNFYLRKCTDVASCMSAAADSISEGDIIDSVIRGSNQEWSLAPLHAVISTCLPAYYMHGGLNSRIEFSSWLGNNSKQGKNMRLLSQLVRHTYVGNHHNALMNFGLGGRLGLRLDYATHLASKIIGSLMNNKIDLAIAVMDTYCLCRDDVDALLDLVIDDKLNATAYSKIPTTTKTAFTRKYNASCHWLPYSLGGTAPAASIVHIDVDLTNVEQNDIGDDSGESIFVEDGESVEDLSRDKMIKEKKPSKTSTTAKSKRGGAAKK